MTDETGTTPLDDVNARLDALAREADAIEGDVSAAVGRLRTALARVREEIDRLADAAEPAGGHAADADVDGARITALDLVLRGTPRAQAQALLAEQFPGIDAALLLDEIDTGP